MEITYDDVAGLLRGGAGVALMMRHAERPHIDPEDPTFGESLPITEAGAEKAKRVGEKLKGAAGSVCFLSSPLNRTRLTAANVAHGMGVDDTWNFDTIPVDKAIGNSSFYYADVDKVWRLFRGGAFYELSFKYIRDGEMEGFAPLAEATDALEDFILKHATAQLSIFTTHDLFTAAFLSGRGAAPEWTIANWVAFLDSAAIITHPDGRREYAIVRS